MIKNHRDFSNWILEKGNVDSLDVSGPPGGRDIYRRNYIHGHISVLKKVYISISFFLENDNFCFFAKRYLQDHPPSSPEIEDIIRPFKEYLASCSELHDFPFVKALASIDFFLNSYESEGLRLPRGSLTIWEKIMNRESVDLSNISDNGQYEMIRKIFEDGDTFLVSDSDVR